MAEPRVDLEAIKTRAAKPDKVLSWSNPYSDEYIGALQDSQDDVLVLVAEVERLRSGVVADAEASNPDKRRALDLLWKLEDVVYDATTERPFSDYKLEYDADDERIFPDQPQTDAGYAALTLIWIVMLGLDRESGG